MLVTGAAGGIGRALVRAFEGAGYRVLAVDRSERPDDLACAHYLQVDLASTVGDEHEACAVFARVRALLGGGGLNALVHNAAVQVLGGADTLTRADWHRTLDVNLLAPFFWTQALLPELEAAQGSVIHISSIHARLTKKDFVAYATSKAALSGMTRALAVDLGGRVRVNAIEPAAIDTEMLRSGFEGQPEILAELKRYHPSSGIASPTELASFVLAVAEGAPFLTGSCIAFDGAIGARLHDPA